MSILLPYYFMKIYLIYRTLLVALIAFFKDFFSKHLWESEKVI